MKTKLKQSVLMLFLVVGMFSVGAGRVEALSSSQSWNGSLSGTFNYYWDGFGAGGDWAPGLANPNATVTYNAQVKKNGISLVGNTVSVGDTITFEPIPYQDTDISWFGTGYSSDSPYGRWKVNADAPDPILGIEWQSLTPVELPPPFVTVLSRRNINTCRAGDYVNTVYPSGMTFDVYIPFSVNYPSSITYDHSGSSAGLSCDGNGQNCTVTSPGSIIGHVNFGSTYGKFYYRYYDYRGGPRIAGRLVLTLGANCYGNNIPMATISIDPVTVLFSLTAVSSNNPPTTPTLSVDAPSKNINTDFIFTTSPSTDPDGDTIRYGFDFTGIAVTPGLYTPATATLASGTAQSAPYQWPTPGTYSVRVRAEDNRGGVSGWSPTISVTVNALPLNPIINTFTINGSTGSVNLLRGDMRNIAWTVSNAVSCSASSGDIWSGNKSIPTGNDALPANVTTPHTLDCVNAIGVHTSSTIQVNVSCTPSTGTFGTCACATETKTRTNTSALCISVIESTSCDVNEKKACRNFNWIEGAP